MGVDYRNFHDGKVQAHLLGNRSWINTSLCWDLQQFPSMVLRSGIARDHLCRRMPPQPYIHAHVSSMCMQHYVDSVDLKTVMEMRGKRSWRDGSVLGTLATLQRTLTWRITGFNSQYTYCADHCHMELQLQGTWCPLLASPDTGYTHGIQTYTQAKPPSKQNK